MSNSGIPIISDVARVVERGFRAVGRLVKEVFNGFTSLVNMVISPFMGNFGSLDIPNQSESIKGVLVTKQGSNLSVPIIYGYRQVGGIVTFAETGSTNNKYLWVAYVLSEGPVHQMQELFINDIQISGGVVSALNAGGVVAVNDGSKFAGRTVLQFFKGDYYANTTSSTIGSTAKADIFQESPSWTTDMHYNGLALLLARYEWKDATTQEEADNNPFTGQIPTVRASIQGRTLAPLTITGFDGDDIPTGTSGIEAYTYGGVGYTERWSMNPAEILLDYLRNPRYGKGLVNDDIDWNSFYTAAYKCNQTVEYITGVFGPALTLNYVIDTSATIFNNVKLILQNMRSYLPYSRGKYFLRIEDAGNPTDITSGVATIVKTFNKDNIVGTITYTGIDKTNKYNQVVVKYVDPDNKWSEQSVVYPPTESQRSLYIALDNNRENKGEFTFAGITNYSIAYNFAKLIFNKSRYQDSLSFTAGSEAFDLEPGDNIYLEANMLKFGTDPEDGAIPWRIISMNVNQDYTYDIGCIRNPDSLYPNTVANEIDYKIAVFVPDGANRKYPQEPIGIPVGLNPPALVDSPDPTNPNFQLDDFITIAQSTYVVEDGLTYVILEFYQPEVPQYFKTTLWWKTINSNVLVWNRVEVTDRSEAGALIRTKLGPVVPYVSYEIRSRVQYTNGDYSQALGRIQITVEPNGTEDPKDYSEFIDGGWQLVTTPPLNPRNTRIDYITAEVQTGVDGFPLPLRKIKFSGKEFYNNILNPSVVGLIVNWKQSSATYWKVKEVRFPPTYRDAGGFFEFEIDDLGIRQYPAIPGPEQNFDFVIKYLYDDLSVSTIQLTARNIPVEINDQSDYSYDAFAPYANVYYTDNSVGKALPLESMAPPGAVLDVREINIGLKSIVATATGISSYEIRYQVYLPAIANRINFYGIRVYYRPVIQGQSPDYQVKEYFPLPNIKNLPLESEFTLRGLTQSARYEVVIVPVVNYLGTKTEANNSWFSVSTARLSGADTISLLNDYKLTLTQEAKKSLLTTFPITDPTPNVISWARVHTTTPISYSTSNWYYQLRVQVPLTGFQELQIYRRSRTDGYSDGTTVAKYWGTGRWEKLVVTTSTHTFDANGQATINLRPPVDFDEYDRTYEINSLTLVDPQWGDALTPLLKPLNVEYFDAQHEFFLVLKVSGVTSVVGALLPRYRYNSTVANQGAVQDILGGQIPPKVLTADYELYDVGYARKLTEHRLRLNNNQLVTISYRDGSRTYTPPTVTPGVI